MSEHETTCPGCGETVTVEFDYSPAEQQTREYPGCPAQATVDDAFVDCPYCGRVLDREAIEAEIIENYDACGHCDAPTLISELSMEGYCPRCSHEQKAASRRERSRYERGHGPGVLG